MDPARSASDLVASTLVLELQECRCEALAAQSQELRTWHDGRATGLERAISILDQMGRAGRARA